MKEFPLKSKLSQMVLIGTLALGGAALPATSFALNTNPIQFSDCVANADDCCNPACKNAISACCSTGNKCGLPTASFIKGKGPFAGMQLSCKDLVSSYVLNDQRFCGPAEFIEN